LKAPPWRAEKALKVRSGQDGSLRGLAAGLYAGPGLVRSFSGVRIVDAPNPGHLTPEKVAESLADPYARRVLAVCVKQARPVKAIAHETGLPLPTAYRHVNKLEESGLLIVERSAMTPDGKKYDLYRSRVKSARIEMDGAGERVTWEPNEATEERLASMWDSLRGARRL